MMQNMNMMDYEIQNLMNMKNQLTFIESQFNLLLANIQNQGIANYSYPNLINLSFQFINFGIDLLNIGVQHMDDMTNTMNIKSQLEESIKKLKIINQKYYNDSKFFYNVKFNVSNGQRYVITCDSNNTVDYLIKEFLKRVGRYNLFNMENKVYSFIFNALPFNTGENKPKKLLEIFSYFPNTVIYYKELGL